MTLQDELEATGAWLFRWRSFFPLVLLIPLLVEMQRFEWPMQSHRLQVVWELCCFAVSVIGLAVRVMTVGHRPAGTSGRNTLKQIAHSLNTTGMYSIVRHPLYLGNFLMWLGLAMFSLDWRLLVIFILAFWLYYERIMLAEESFLRRKFGQQFENWAANTPAFIPRLRGWQPPTLPFSFRTVLKQEYTSFFLLPAGFIGLELVEHLVVEKRLVVEPHWVILGLVGLLSYLVLRTLKKRTRLLHVEGR